MTVQAPVPVGLAGRGDHRGVRLVRAARPQDRAGLGRPERAFPIAAELARAVGHTDALAAIWVRPVLAASRAALGLPVLEDELPAPVPGTDPALDRLTRRFADPAADLGPLPPTGLLARRLHGLGRDHGR